MLGCVGTLACRIASDSVNKHDNDPKHAYGGTQTTFSTLSDTLFEDKSTRAEGAKTDSPQGHTYEGTQQFPGRREGPAP